MSMTPLEVFKQSFSEYLWETQVVATQAQLNELLAILHEPLPVSFRINLHRTDAQHIINKLLTECQFPANTYSHNGITINPPTPIPWYPLPNVAWQVDCGRNALSKSAPLHESIKNFHSLLLSSTDLGVIDRQEAVSMLPVLFLRISPGHIVLDMCASPGSKTTQALDFLIHTSTIGSGMVIANDLDKKRAYMLVHRLSRNTLRNAVVTCGSGITFPGLYRNQKLERTNVFDRVLCDVPCSGDGTLRKNQSLWKEWHIGQGLTLHTTQIALALRSAALLKIGGIMVYSTCSFNAVENEAVVAELLRRSNGSLELMDVSDELPGLITRPGRTKWPVGWRSKSKSTHKGHEFASKGEKKHDWYSSYHELPLELRGQRICQSMFPPATDSIISRELTKTVRLIPIDQNSGGFFIAVLRKVRNLPSMNTEDQVGLPPLQDTEEIVPPDNYTCKLCNLPGHYMKHCAQYLIGEQYEAFEPSIKKHKKALVVPKETKRETPYRLIADDVWLHLCTFYGIDSNSPLRFRLWSRSDGASAVNYVDEAISDSCFGSDEVEFGLEIVNTGLKVFMKQVERTITYYRPTEDALGFMETFLTKRLIELDKCDFVVLLEDLNKHTAFTSLSSSARTLLESLEQGPIIIRLSTNHSIGINAWIGTRALLPRISKTKKIEIDQLLSLEMS